MKNTYPCLPLPLVFLVLMSMFAPSTFADIEYGGNIPMEIAEVLIPGFYGGPSKIYEDVVESFPSFKIPDGFELVGSVDKFMDKHVILTTDFELPQVIESLTLAFNAENFTLIDAPLYRDPLTGFHYPEVWRSGQYLLCHEESGFLTFSVLEKEINKVVLLTLVTRNPPLRDSCEEVQAAQTSAYESSLQNRGVWRYAPLLALPGQIHNKSIMTSPGISINSPDYQPEIQSVLIVDLTLDEVFSHFSEQLENQEWEPAGLNTNANSANSIWRKTPEQDIQLIGTFSVSQVNDNEFQLLFRID